MGYKVLVICGSPRRSGCTNRALEEVCRVLNEEGVETEWIRSEWRRYVSVMENWVFLSKEVA